MPDAKPPSYWDYLKLDGLLGLQGGLENDESQITSDELHFIVVHQVYELWFKLVLRELRLGRDELAAPRVAEEAIPRVVHHLRRVNEIFKLGVDQFRVMETLTPQDFLDFRDKLSPASGFQSFQMREMEILLGLAEADRVQVPGMQPLHHIRKMAPGTPAGDLANQRIEAAARETTLRSALHDWLHRTPIQGSVPQDAQDDQAVLRFLEEYLRAYQQEQQAQAARLVEVGVGSADTIQARFSGSIDAARAFLFADDVDDKQRVRVRRIRAGILFVESYRALPLLAWPRLLIDTVVEMEELLVLWRNRHARMVERTVGRRVGTGGSPGVDYLDRTAAYRIFTELWTVRTLLLPRQALPALRAPELYGFAR
jgi:tryptophan 2,3-dioxygenase